MRFAISTSQQETTWDELLTIWKAADDIDIIESAWVFDHFYPIFSDSTGPCLEGWVTLTALAQATHRLRFGTMVTGMVYRHPAVLANMVATLDIVSGGRLELGIGAGWNEEECDAYGIELGSLGQRFDRFAEGLAVITGLLQHETTDFEGQWYNLHAARCEPKPLQRPYPPICIGGGGELRTLPLVARWADHWNFPGNGTDNLGDLARKRRVLAAACAEVGRDPATITVSTQVWWPPGSPVEAVVEQAHAYEEAGVDLAILVIPRPRHVGTLEVLAEAVRPLANATPAETGHGAPDG